MDVALLHLLLPSWLPSLSCTVCAVQLPGCCVCTNATRNICFCFNVVCMQLILCQPLRALLPLPPSFPSSSISFPLSFHLLILLPPPLPPLPTPASSPSILFHHCSFHLLPSPYPFSPSIPLHLRLMPGPASLCKVSEWQGAGPGLQVSVQDRPDSQVTDQPCTRQEGQDCWLHHQRGCRRLHPEGDTPHTSY